ncbi:MAG TPA: YcgL domain-containing protein [Chiayiivirga sp.]|nr:YcgL domain-containing protein [Chiayiivirga sp.]
MRCHVYKSRKRPDAYVYVDEHTDPANLPEALRNALGPLDPALSFDLTAERRLARADAATVITAIALQGYYVQLPPSVDESS